MTQNQKPPYKLGKDKLKIIDGIKYAYVQRKLYKLEQRGDKLFYKSKSHEVEVKICEK